MKKICINNRDEMVMLFVGNIAYVMADGNYTKICYIGGMNTVLSFGLSKVEKMISEIEYSISINNPGLKYWHFFGHHHSNKATFREVCLYEGVVKLVDNNYEYVC